MIATLQRPHALRILLTTLAALMLVVAPASAVLVDDFSAGDKPIFDNGSSNLSMGNSIGGNLNLTLSSDGTAIFGVDASGLFLEVGAGMRDGGGEPVDDGPLPPTTATAEATWDGNSNPGNFDATGLGGVDFSADSAFRLTVEEAEAGAELVLRVFTDASNSSVATLVLPAVAASTDFLIPYSQLADENGAGADLSNVGAIRLKISGVEPQLVVFSNFDTTGAAVEVTMVDLFTNDADIGATDVNPGDQIKYRITVTNSGGDALGLNVEVDTGIDGNAMVNSVETQPVAINDTYVAFGNATLDVDMASGTLANDADPDGDSPQVDIGASDAASAQGGTIAWNDVGAGMGDGAFTYNPAAGFRGIDTFSYTAVDDDGRSDTATVSVLIESTIWFVDNTHGGADEGTLANPFQSITATNLNGAGGSGDVDAAGDIIFFFTGTGTYAGGLQLEDDQMVLGPEDGLTVNGVEIVADNDDARPTITAAAGNGLTLASDNTIRALNIGNAAAGVSLVGTNFGTLTISEAAITGSGGAVDLDNGTAAVALENITSTSGALGIDLSSVDGNFVVAGTTTIDGTTGTAIRVDSGGSTYTFGTTSIGQTTSVDVGVRLTSSATSTFNFDSLDITTDSGAGLFATSAGTVNIGGTSSTINAVGGAGIFSTSTAFDNGVGGGGATFASVSSSGSPNQGISLGTITGNLTMNGGAVGTATMEAFAVSGGASNITYAGSLTNTADSVVQVTARTGGTVTASGTINETGDGIRVFSNTGGTTTFSGGTKTVNTGASTAVDLSNNTGHTVNFSGGGLDIDTTTGVGFDAEGGGAVNSSGAGNTVTSTGAIAVDIDAVTTGLSFASISSTSSATRGIELTDLADGSSFEVTGTTSVTDATTEGIFITSAVNAAIDLDFTGTTTIDNAGNEGIQIDRTDTNGIPTASDVDFGTTDINNRNTTGIFIDNAEGTVDFGTTTIANANNAGGYGIRVEDSSARVTVGAANISDTNQTVVTADGGSDGVPDNDGDGDAIFLTNNTGGFVVNGGTLSNLDTDGIDIRNSGNLVLNGVTIEDIATGSANPPSITDAGIFAINLSGTNLLQDTLIQRAQSTDLDDLIRIFNTATTLDELRLNNCDLTNTTAGTGAALIRGANGFRFEARGAMDAKIIVENDSDFTGIRINALGFALGDGTGSGTGTIDIVVDGSTLDPNGLSVFSAGAIVIGAANDIVIGIQDDYTVNYNISNTTIQNVQLGASLAGILSSVSGDVSAGGPGPSIIGRVVDSTLQDIRGRRGINLISEGQNQSYSFTLQGTSIQDLRQEVVSGATLFAREAVVLSTRDDSTVREFRMINNNIGAGPDNIIQSTSGSLAGDDLPVGDGSSREALDFLIEDNSNVNAVVHNNRILTGAGGTEGFEIDVENSTTLNLTLRDNVLIGELDVNSTSEELFLIDTEAATASAALDIDNNTTNSQEWEIDEGSGPITIENRATVEARNSGSFNFMDTIDDNGGDVPMPAPVVLAVPGRIAQMRMVSTAFLPLNVRAFNPDGTPAVAVTVTFSAPGAGASVTFPGGNSCVTDASGVCGVNATANAAVGAYDVTAAATIAATAAEGAIFYLRNLP